MGLAGHIDARQVLQPSRHLASVKAGLQRLCYSVVHTTYSLADAGALSEVPWVDVWLEGLTAGLSFADFSVMEELEVEQLTPYGSVLPTSQESDEGRAASMTTPGMILGRLPQSLLRLRLGCIVDWSVVLRDMLELSGPQYCPRLEKVELEVFAAPPEVEYHGLVEAMAGRGVQVSLWYVVRHRNSRGLLPAHPNRRKYTRVPVDFAARHVVS